ncbi:MAG: sulfatase [Firmicutes bacterium]|nr:sulfatase [Bacillota bacterium]
MRVLFLDIDTLRPDHMSCYGYKRLTTPNIDEIAKEGVVFENYYCSDAPCLPSRASLISGMFGIHNGAVGHGGTCADRRPYGKERGFSDPIDNHNFNNLFRRAGMHTASISTFSERHSSYWFQAGFNETYNVGGRGMESGEEVIPVALDWVERNGKEDNWFLHLHLWDPHTPYRTPADYENPFEDEPLNTWVTPEIFEECLKHTGPHSLNEITMYNDITNPKYPKHPGKITEYKDLRKIIDGYDCGIRYADELIGKVLALLKAQGVYDDLVIIVTSDHGENLCELGICSEHATADHPTCHIPMIIKWPNGMQNHKDKELHYSLDLVPTMAELLGLEKYDKWDGLSYKNTILKGEKQGRESLVLSQMAHVCQRSARFGEWLYIRTYHDGFHLFDDEMLFNIKHDPYEQNDLKSRYPEVCAQGAKIILDWHDSMMKTSGSTIDPMWTVLKEGGPFHTIGHLEEYIERLKLTGRAEGAEKLRKKYLENR